MQKNRAVRLFNRLNVSGVIFKLATVKLDSRDRKERIPVIKAVIPKYVFLAG
jgi:hypothetical protein